MLNKFIFSRRLTETRSFNRSDSAPWRRSFVSTTQDHSSNTPSKGKLIFLKLWASISWFYYLFIKTKICNLLAILLATILICVFVTVA